jgi:hypothetical protein
VLTGACGVLFVYKASGMRAGGIRGGGERKRGSLLQELTACLRLCTQTAATNQSAHSSVPPHSLCHLNALPDSQPLHSLLLPTTAQPTHPFPCQGGLQQRAAAHPQRLLLLQRLLLPLLLLPSLAPPLVLLPEHQLHPALLLLLMLSLLL